MMQIVEQTREEKIEMYMKSTKRQLIEMLLTNQELLAYKYPQPPPCSPGKVEQDTSTTIPFTTWTWNSTVQEMTT